MSNKETSGRVPVPGCPPLLPLALCAMALLHGCGDSQSNTQKTTTAKPVTIINAQTATLRQTATGVGSLQAIEQVEIRAELAGLIDEIHFPEGQPVDRDDLLFTLDDDKLQQRQAARQAAVEAARADLTNAEWNYDRLRTLRQDGTAAVEEVKQARDDYHAAAARVDRLQAELALVREQLDDTRIRAPFAGRVGRHLVDVGDFVDIGDPLTSLYRIDPIELAFELPENYAGRVQPGQLVTATAAAYPDRRFSGEVRFVSPAVDPQTRNFLVKAHLPNPDGALKPGIFATGKVIIDRHTQNPVIPEECLVNRRTSTAVFIVTDSVARLRDVKIGLRAPGRVEIRQGIQPGAQVVRTGHMQLRDGESVRIVQTADSTPTTTPTTAPTTAEAPDS